MTILVSNTEPQDLRNLGRTTTYPENYGCDLLIPVKGEWVGIQRKEVKDLVASVTDGRWPEQLGKMAQLPRSVILVEGRPRWSDDGRTMLNVKYGKGLTRPAWRGVLWSAQRRGIWVDGTGGLDETIVWVGQFERWLRSNHSSDVRRPGPSGLWGKATNEEWAVWFMQSFQGVGPELAKRIVGKFGVPLRWTIGEEDLLTVEGVGKAKAAAILGALEQVNEEIGVEIAGTAA